MLHERGELVMLGVDVMDYYNLAIMLSIPVYISYIHFCANR